MDTSITNSSYATEDNNILSLSSFGLGYSLVCTGLPYATTTIPSLAENTGYIATFGAITFVPSSTTMETMDTSAGGVEEIIEVIVEPAGTLNGKPYNKVDFFADKIHSKLAPISEQRNGTIIIKGKETKEVFDEICQICGTKENLLIALEAFKQVQETNKGKSKKLIKEDRHESR